MNPRDRLLGVTVAVIWGANFIGIHATLEHFPPLFAGALRFAVIAIPTMLFVPWPKVKVRWLLGYGLGFGTAQFAFLFVGLDLGMPVGLASLVLQSAAPFTVLLGAVVLRERLTGLAIAGITLAVAGMFAIGWQRAEYAALLPVVLTLLAAFSWALSNLCNRLAQPPNPLHFTLWMSVVPPLPLFALSVIFEGPSAGFDAVTSIDTPQGWTAIGGLTYVVLIGTVVGAGLWTTLMRRNPAGAVAPFALLVPIVGMSLAFLLLGERPTLVELVAGAAVIIGVLLGSMSRPQEPAPDPQRPQELAATEAR